MWHITVFLQVLVRRKRIHIFQSRMIYASSHICNYFVVTSGTKQRCMCEFILNTLLHLNWKLWPLKFTHVSFMLLPCVWFKRSSVRNHRVCSHSMKELHRCQTKKYKMKSCDIIYYRPACEHDFCCLQKYSAINFYRHYSKKRKNPMICLA